MIQTSITSLKVNQLTSSSSQHQLLLWLGKLSEHTTSSCSLHIHEHILKTRHVKARVTPFPPPGLALMPETEILRQSCSKGQSYCTETCRY